MKAKLLKMSVITTMVMFLFAGTTWADRGKDRHPKEVRNKHIRTENDKNRGPHESSHYNRGWYEHPRHHYKKHYTRHPAAHRAAKNPVKHGQRYHRPVHRHDSHRPKVIGKHYHKRKPSYNVFSFRVPAFEPGWSVTFKTKSGW